MKIIYIIFFFLYPQIRSNCSHLIKISSTSIFPTLLSNTKNFPSIPLSKAWTDIPFPSRKTLFSLPKHVPRESFDHSSFRYQQPGDTSSLWTKVHSHTHTHIRHKIFRLSSRPVHRCRRGVEGKSYSVVSLSCSPRGLAEK